MEPTQHDTHVPRTPSAAAGDVARGVGGVGGVGGVQRRHGRGRVRAIARAAGRSCSRPGCEAPAGATLVFSYREQVARLVELLDEGEPQAYDLCPAHADRTSPPVGWELSDTRPPRSDSPRRLDDDETVAVLAAALRGETPPTRVDVLEGGRTDDEDVVGETDRDTAAAAAPDDEEDPLRAALEELQRVATPDDDLAAQPVPTTPLRRGPREDARTAAHGGELAADLTWTDLDLSAEHGHDGHDDAGGSGGSTDPTLW